MRFAFFRSKETEAVRIEKLKLKAELAEKKRLERQQSWNRAKLGCFGFVFVSLAFLALLAWINKDRPVNYIERPIVKPFSKAISPHDAEKQYEHATGKEIVHRKDGTMYVREQPKRK
ncbi:MAG: hypothetical protein WCH39_01710 [Schlesneria sp.]